MLDEQLDSFRFNFLKDKRNVFEIFPELKPVLDDRGFSDELVRYIVLCYDPESPLVTAIVDLDHRKTMAADLADLKEREKAFDLSEEDIVNGVVDYLFYRHNRKKLAIQYSMQAFYEYTKLILTPLSKAKDTTKDKDILSAAALKSKLMDDCDKINERIDKYIEGMSDDDRLKEHINQRITPLAIAEKIQHATTV